MTSILVDGREFVAGRRTGIGRFLEGLLQALCRRHPQWHIDLGMHESAALPIALQGSMRVRALPRFAEFAWPRWSKDYDLFLSPYPKLPLLPLGCPAVHTVHDVLYLTHPAYRASWLKRRLSLYVLKSSLAKASLSWFVSEASRHECERLTAMGGGGVVRHQPVSDLFQPAAKDSHEDYYLFVGNGLPHKNLDIVVQAMQKVPGSLKCVGVRDDIAHQLRQRYPDLADRVEFVGQVDDAKLLWLYQHALALLQPSTAEGYGYPPLEAMACGTPAILSNIAALKESSGGHAFYCDPYDVEAWREAMCRVREPAVRAHWRTAGLAWMVGRQGNAGWQGHIDDIERLVSR